MNGSGVLIDSVILIDHLNGVSAATSYLQKIGRVACISAITRAEVLTGLSGDAWRTVAQFLDCFRFLPLDREAADLAAELRRLHRWKLPDAFQAAVARHHKLSLATRNTADFNPKLHPFVIIPYNL